MREVITEYRPAVVFHAAAYKHVTMMELNPVEAIRNNALATQLVARIAGETGVGTFVLVSTDKAVKPATVMGASKALAEWAVEAAATRYPETSYATVRFGNVLGSSGSVVPIFRRQIAAGGPVTVTDERMKRYFMTIPEAVQLIIRAGSLSEAQRRAVRARDGRAGQDHRAGGDDDPPLRARARARHRDRDRRRATRGEAPRGPVQPVRASAADARPEDRRAPQRDPVDPAWVERTFTELNLLVLEDDAAALAQHVARLAARAPRPLEGRRRPAWRRRLGRAWRRSRSPSRSTTSSRRSERTRALQRSSGSLSWSSCTSRTRVKPPTSAKRRRS